MTSSDVRGMEIISNLTYRDIRMMLSDEDIRVSALSHYSSCWDDDCQLCGVIEEVEQFTLEEIAELKGGDDL